MLEAEFVSRGSEFEARTPTFYPPFDPGVISKCLYDIAFFDMETPHRASTLIMQAGGDVLGSVGSLRSGTLSYGGMCMCRLGRVEEFQGYRSGDAAVQLFVAQDVILNGTLQVRGEEKLGENSSAC
jgi:hypothetical protein